MEPKASLPCSLELTIGPCPEPDAYYLIRIIIKFDISSS